MSKLFSSLKIKDIILKNRIAMSPMCQYGAREGFANDYHLVHYGARAIGGTGLIIQEATAVSPAGRITPGDLGLWDDRQVAKLRDITDFIHEHGSVAGIQLAHAGRKASCAMPWHGGRQLGPNEGGWQTVSSSAIPFNPDDLAPQALDEEGLHRVVEDFRAASKRALEAGYKVLEIHAAHGYLIHQFLSPLCNNRNDRYGGNFENRTRLILEITDAVNTVWPANLPLLVRLSASDYIEGGWDPDQTVKLSALLKDKGVDLLDTSSGGMVPYAKMPFAPGYQVPFAERVKKESGIMTGAVGLITQAKQAEEIVALGQADIIFLGRELLRDPQFALRAAHELGADIEWPVRYIRAKTK